MSNSTSPSTDWFNRRTAEADDRDIERQEDKLRKTARQYARTSGDHHELIDDALMGSMKILGGARISEIVKEQYALVELLADERLAEVAKESRLPTLDVDDDGLAGALRRVKCELRWNTEQDKVEALPEGETRWQAFGGLVRARVINAIAKACRMETPRGKVPWRIKSVGLERDLFTVVAGRRVEEGERDLLQDTTREWALDEIAKGGGRHYKAAEILDRCGARDANQTSANVPPHRKAIVYRELEKMSWTHGRVRVTPGGNPVARWTSPPTAHRAHASLLPTKGKGAAR